MDAAANAWMRGWSGRAIALLIFACGVGACADALATTLTAAEQQGVTWLSSQVQSNGSLAAEGASIATGLQAREEVAVTLAALANSHSSALASAVAANTDSNAEAIARRIIAASATAEASDTRSRALRSVTANCRTV